MSANQIAGRAVLGESHRPDVDDAFDRLMRVDAVTELESHAASYARKLIEIVDEIGEAQQTLGVSLRQLANATREATSDFDGGGRPDLSTIASAAGNAAASQTKLDTLVARYRSWIPTWDVIVTSLDAQS